MKELKIINEDDNFCAMEWETLENEVCSIVEGVTQTFEYQPIMRIKRNSAAIRKDQKYVGYRVSYAMNLEDTLEEIIIDSTNVVLFSTDSEMISIVPLRAYGDLISLSFVSEVHYDLYRLYDEKGTIVLETEDCIALGRYEGGKYYVVGYMKIDNQYKQKGSSELTICKPYKLDFMEKPKLSIVIPVYNVHDFLPRTMQSILSSLWREFEIILVNDGSTDGSLQVCNWYAENYPCVRVVNQKNSGVATARNHGVDIAKGEWLAFVDSDDIIHPYMYKKLYETAVEGNFDIAIAQCLMRGGFEKHSYVLSSDIDEKMIVMDSFREVMESRGNKRNIFFVAVWNKIVKMDIARKVRFWDGMPHYEDVAYTPALYSYIDRFVLVKDAYYVWDKRKQKTVGTLSTKKDNKRSNEEIWRCYFWAYASPLFIGNKSQDSEEVYKLDILKGLLTKYMQQRSTLPVKNVICGMMKYFVREHSLPVEKLSKIDPSLAETWEEISKSNVREWDGIGDIPKEYYKCG